MNEWRSNHTCRAIPTRTVQTPEGIDESVIHHCHHGIVVIYVVVLTGNVSKGESLVVGGIPHGRCLGCVFWKIDHWDSEGLKSHRVRELERSFVGSHIVEIALRSEGGREGGIDRKGDTQQLRSVQYKRINQDGLDGVSAVQHTTIVDEDGVPSDEETDETERVGGWGNVNG
jgi:hypothetical protein